MNNSKLTFLGMGIVGSSLLGILLKSGLFTIEDIRVIDSSMEALEVYRSFGGIEENFTHLHVDSKCFKEIFTPMNKGDFLVRLANGCGDMPLLKECQKRGIHYLCTSDDSFLDLEDTEAFRYRTHFYNMRKLMEETKECATSILQFGMNPGLISILTKKALIEIVENDDGDYVVQNREHLKSLANAGEFASLAKELKVTAFIEADFDTTQTDIREDENTIYNSWNIDDFYEEMNDRSIQKVGSLVALKDHLERFGILPEQIYYYNKHDGTLVIDAAGKDLKAKAYSGKEIFEGCIDAHEELFTIHDYYTIRDDEGEIEYAPSVVFIYRPCDCALNSVYRTDKDLFQKGKYQVMPITNDRIISGTERVGVSVEGESFHTVYVGVAPDFDKDSFETTTVLPVSVSAYAAICYILNHPEEGILYPEYLDINEVISYIERFMPVVSEKI